MAELSALHHAIRFFLPTSTPEAYAAGDTCRNTSPPAISETSNSVSRAMPAMASERYPDARVILPRATWANVRFCRSGPLPVSL
jgi:hypothetical protein